MNRSAQTLYKGGQGDDGGCWAVQWGEGVYPSQLGPGVVVEGVCPLEVLDSKRLKNPKGEQSGTAQGGGAAGMTVTCLFNVF